MENNPLNMKEEVFRWWESFSDPYERLAGVGRYLLLDNPEATIYDMFNFIREDLFKGWKYDENSKFIKDIDYEIDYGFKSNL